MRALQCEMQAKSGNGTKAYAFDDVEFGVGDAISLLELGYGMGLCRAVGKEM